MKKALTAQAIAAMAAGAAIKADVTPEAAALEAAAAEAAALEAAAAEAAALEAAAADAGTKLEAPDALVTYLKAQVTSKDESLSALNIKLATLEAQLAEQKETFPALVSIAAASANNMQIALGGSALDMSAMAPLLILAEHSRVSAVFQTKFKAGGVAAVDAATLTEKEPVQDGLYQARLDSVRPTAKK